MKTNDHLRGLEATELLRNVTMYGSLLEQQVYRLFPDKSPSVLKRILDNLEKQGRVYRNATERRYSVSEHADKNLDSGMTAALWVLADFITKVEYHTVSEFPVKLCMFTDGELYDVVFVLYGQEALINHALAEADENTSRRIVIVESVEQIDRLGIPSVKAYCTVGQDGVVTYYG